jgi:hypothetical protein
MLNITIHQAYVPYMDQCTSHHLDIMDASRYPLLERFCGHTYQEVVYTEGHQAVVEISAAHKCVYLNAVYQVHIKGYAYKFMKFDKIPIPPSWQITLHKSLQISHAACKIYVKNFYHLTWFYTKPVIKYRGSTVGQWCDKRFRKGNRGISSVHKLSKTYPCYGVQTTYAQTFWYLSIKQFECQTNASALYVQDGLGPHRTDSAIFECNQQHIPIIPIVRKHKFTRIDLHLSLLDPAVIFTMTLNETQVLDNVESTEVVQSVSSNIAVYNYDSPLIYYSADSYLSLTVTSFAYRGPHANIMADNIHSLPLQRYRWEQIAFLPKGKLFVDNITYCLQYNEYNQVEKMLNCKC